MFRVYQRRWGRRAPAIQYLRLVVIRKIGVALDLACYGKSIMSSATLATHFMMNARSIFVERVLNLAVRNVWDFHVPYLVNIWGSVQLHAGVSIASSWLACGGIMNQ
jgi:hypothetical protein